MGKSYKKNPIATEGNGSGTKKARKRMAWKKIRAMIKRGVEIPNGSGYKKCVESWDICDYKFRLTEEDAVDQYYEYIECDRRNGNTWTLDRWPTLEAFKNWWRKCYKSK